MASEEIEQINLRRWAIEQLAPVTSIGQMTDVAQLCRAADALIQYRLTGAHPSPLDGNGRDNGGPLEHSQN